MPFRDGTAVLFSDERLLFQIRFRALSSVGGQLVFSGNEAEEVENETTLIKPDPGVSVPSAQILYVPAPSFSVAAGAGEGEFTNPNNRYDVTNDGYVTPSDALALVNFLNSSGTTVLSGTAAGGEGEAGHMYYDVNSDYVVSPSDVLGVINFLNAAVTPSAGEGEAAAELLVSASPPESPLASGLPAWDLLRSPSASTVLVAAASSADWALPEIPEEAEYFAATGAEDEISQELSLEAILSDALADDIAAAWGQGDALDLLPDEWV